MKKRSLALDDDFQNWLAPDNAPPVALRRYAYKGGGGGLLSVALPVLGALSGGALLGPALATSLGVSSAVGAGLGAGLGGFGGSLIGGNSVGNALKTGAISGIGAGVLSSLGGATPSVTGATAGGAGGAAGGGAFPAELAFDPTAGVAETIGSGAGAIESAPLAAPFNPETGLTMAAAPAQAAIESAPLGPLQTTVGSGAGAITSEALPAIAGTNIATAAPASATNVLTDMGGTVPGPLGNIPASAGAEINSTGSGGFGPQGTPVNEALTALNIPGVGGTPPTKPFFERMGSVAMEQLGKNPLGVAVAGLGLARNLMTNEESPEQRQLRELAERSNAQSSRLSSFLENGTLPPGAQTSLDNAVRDAETAIRAKHAQNGTSGSSMEIQEINALKERAAAQGFAMARDLLNSGIQESGLSGNLYNALLNLQQRQAEETGAAVSDFANALAGGTTVNVRR